MKNDKRKNNKKSQAHVELAGGEPGEEEGGNNMLIDTSNVVSMQQANRNFSEVSRLVENKGSAVILKNNKPKYLVVKVEDIEQNVNPSSDENIMAMSQALMNMNKEAYKELAK